MVAIIETNYRLSLNLFTKTVKEANQKPLSAALNNALKTADKEQITLVTT